MITLEKVTKRYGETLAVDGLSLEVARGEVCVLIGPSGCGKTTTLRMINRLVRPTSGRIFIDGKDTSQVDPEKLRRSIGYAIQSVGLFPHLTVAENIAVVPQLLHWDKRTHRQAHGTSCWSWWDLTPTSMPANTPPSSPAARPSASGWPAPWPPTRPSCSWTSRSAPSTPLPARGSRPSSCASSRG